MRLRSVRRGAWSLVWVTAACLAPGTGHAEEARTTQSLNADWRFRQSADLAGVEQVTFDDSRWSRVDLPHTWNRLGNGGVSRDPSSDLAQGVGWYRHHFTVSSKTGEARYFVQFDGVGAIADVWLNGRYLGHHAGAFARFRFDATSALKPSGDNLMVVKADNSRPKPASSTADVIPLSGDFFVYGGLYRNVSLITVNPVHVDLLDAGGPGIYVRERDIHAASATVKVTARVVNDAATARTIEAETSITDAAGASVAATHRQLSLPSGLVRALQTQMRIGHPRLWRGRADPYLYQVTLTLRSSRGGEVLDRMTQPLGLRTVRFDPEHGFFLNGKHLLLKGAAMHQDRALRGWAISAADQQQDFEILGDLGANAVRLAHYQHDQESYDQADRRGIIVWAEIPLVNQVSFDGSPASAALRANAEQQLIELIRQNYNHPSVVVWSIGNEVDLAATQTRGRSQGASLLKELDRLAKREDPDRATTLADCCEIGIAPNIGAASAAGVPRDVLVGLTDVVGYNRYFGWYYGQLADLGPMLDAAHARHPRLPLAVSEFGAGAALTQHTDDPRSGPVNPHGRPHPEEFQSLYHEQSWPQLREREYCWGVFIWNLFDFSSSSRHEGDSTDMNDKGLVSFDRRIRKDAFYFYRANWNPAPTLHLTGRRYVDRAYAVQDVKAYSNAARARLSVNGMALGDTSCGGGICIWPQVHLAPGRNELLASAEIAGGQLTDRMQWTYAGASGIVRIKAGDLAGYTTATGARFGSDLYFSGGHGAGINAPDTPEAKRIAVRAADAGLYTTYREGSFQYRIPLPHGRYRLLLRFTEPTATASGERLFDVDVDGRSRLQRFDIFAAAGGKLIGMETALEVTVSDEELRVAFRPEKGQALVSALELTPLERSH